MAATSKSAPDPLASYWAKRNFDVTAEPRGEQAASGEALSFVIQKHAASRLHYDFRLELDGVLVSWAVPKGPSFDPSDKRMAIHVEDHPLSYGSFEGTIPPKQYGAGTVIVWDNGFWTSVGDAHEGLKKGKLVFELHGQKMAGLWELVRIAKPGDKQEAWLLFKKRDDHARPKAEYDVVSALPDSVIAKPLKAAAKKSATPAAKKEKEAAPNARAGVPGAVKAPLPEMLSPQLATLATGVPQGEWIYELKFDGYRLLARIDKGKAMLFTRNGNDWTSKMPQLAAALGELGVKSAWLDGEIVVMGSNGTPDFNALQNAFDKKARSADIVFFLFDVPFFEGYDLREVELVHRRGLLKALLDERGGDLVRFSEAFDATPDSLLESACRMHLEGVIAKRADSTYVSRRSDSWLKLKCKLRQEFVVCGYTDRSDGARQIGSLLLGIHNEEGELVSAGSVGTGWNTEKASELKQQLAKMEVADSPFAAGPSTPGRWSKRKAGSEKWVEPKLIAEVEFAEWTPDNQIRHASFIALRSDKPAKAITRERAKVIASPNPAPASKSAGSASSTSVKVSNPERVIDPTTKLTKLDLVRYYESVAAWILPHLKGRPVSLVRGPTGVTGELFFQKHDDKLSIPGMRELPAELWPGHAPLLEVADAKALVNAAQMNVIEFHTWNSTAKSINKPDRIVFDLDPGEGAPWEQVQEAAVLVRVLLEQLGLECWLKTSGGKGLHVVVPIAARLEYDAVKAFSQAVVQHLAKTIPSRFVAKSGPKNRVGKLFVDYLRNGHGATTATAFSARARPGLGVSVPVSWDELSKLKSGAHWTITTVREHLSFQKNDPWAEYWKKRQTLSAAIRILAA
ncbi:DNA ligase D [Hydrogenophaga sp.]|uniref:DNA ligase D n=1 Tax=Hydrogenophaga sp. TaxID=1904254 RepID=UPI002726DCC0|nr:DNA ligase D [Hydrogenophaga sp.]MDO9437735.1 DNA ligase D [Hydrogenophaga sp.]